MKEDNKKTKPLICIGSIIIALLFLVVFFSCAIVGYFIYLQATESGISAKEAYEIISPEIEEWDSNAKLIWVGTGQETEIFDDGTSKYWEITLIDTTETKGVDFSINSDKTYTSSYVNIGQEGTGKAIIGNWTIDSTRALVLAKESIIVDDYLSRNANAEINEITLRGNIDETSCFWNIHWTAGLMNPDPLTVFINGTSGGIEWTSL